MIFLRYLATGSFMQVCSELCFVSKAMAWRSIHRVIKCLCGLQNRFIRFPERSDFQRIELSFREKKGFPGIIGCVDGTHIPLWVPASDRRETFRNRKGFLSLNCQMVCGPRGEIFDCVTGWPGSAHDSRIWKESQVMDIASRMPNEYHILGDSAYPLSTFLMPPFKNPQTRIHRIFLQV